MALLTLINGPMATGKSTLAKRLSEEVNVPFFSKDGIKESIFNGLGHADRHWATKVGGTAYEVLYDTLPPFLATGRPVIIESNFTAGTDEARFRKLQGCYDFKMLQLMCHAKGEVLLKRIMDRVASGHRHEGHGDIENYFDHELRYLSGRLEPLDLGCPTMVIDTTDFSKVDYDDIFQTVREMLRELGVDDGGRRRQSVRPRPSRIRKVRIQH